MGRPITGGMDPESVKRRKQKREWYQKQTAERKKQIVANRSKSAQREADARRDKHPNAARDALHKKVNARNAKAHPEKETARDARPKRPAGQGCTFPGCDRPGTEWHHTSYDPPRGTWRCPRHNPRGGAA